MFEKACKTTHGNAGVMREPIAVWGLVPFGADPFMQGKPTATFYVSFDVLSTHSCKGDARIAKLSPRALL